MPNSESRAKSLSNTRRQPIRQGAVLAAVFAIYFLAGKFGLRLAFVNLSASAVWPPTGIALASFLLLGYRVWPAILLGAFAVNVTTQGSITTSLGIAIGNTLEGVAGAWFVTRFAAGRDTLERPADVFKFAFFAGIASTAVSATFGVTTLALGGYANWSDYGSIWLTWWLGDAVGAVVVAPLVLQWSRKPRRPWRGPQWYEIFLLLALVVAVGMGVFANLLDPGRHHPLEFLCLPLLLWPAFRFGQREAVTASFLLSVIAIWGTLHGYGPFVGETQNESFLLLQAYMGVVTVMTIAVGAAVSERKQVEWSLQAARAEAERANRLKDDFLAIVSHELRTPLTAILGWAKMLRRAQLDTETREHALEVVERNAKAQAQLIDEVLDISRIVSGKLRLEVKPLTLAPIVESCIDAVQPDAEAKGIHLEKSFGSAEAVVLGDAGRIRQIVSNLLSNAVKFTAGGGRVQVELRTNGSNAEVAVMDTGQGIKPEFLPHLFERFCQGDASVTRAHGGLGLGLAIVKHLVDLHGGTVKAFSDGAGRGASFVVWLPLAGEESESAATGEQEAGARDGAPEKWTPKLRGFHVLLVEDDDDTRVLVAAMLQQFGLRVTATESAAAALEAWDRDRPDLLISDIAMPGEDGYALIRRIRGLEEKRGCQRVPAIALSAHVRPEDRRNALDAGYERHLSKPIDPAVLERTIAQSLGVDNATAAAEGGR